MNLNVEYLFRALDKITPVVKKMARNFIASMKSMAFAVRYYTSPSGGMNFQNISAGLKGLGKSMIAFGKKAKWLSATASIGVWKMLKESMNFEDSQIMFGALIGSAKRGKQLINEIDIMAKKTPMGNKILRDSANIMLQFGVNVKEVLPTLARLGDLSGGNSERFKRMAYTFSEVASMGKLQGRELRELIKAGFNPLSTISKKTGIDMAVLGKAVSAGAISFKMLQKAMVDATSEGGSHFALMKKRAEGASGALDEFRDTFNQVARGLGDELKPAFASVLRKMTAFLDWFKTASPWIRKLVAWTIVLTAVLAPLAIALGSLVFIIGALFSPIGLVIGAVALVVAGFMYWKEIILGLDNLIKDFIEDIKTVGVWMGKMMFWKKDLADEELLEVNKNIYGIGGTNKFDIKNLLTIQNKNNSELNYTPINSKGYGQSMMYGT